MKKNIWIMNHYAGGMLFSKGGRHYAFAKYLKRAGYDPVIFCCNARHNSEQERYMELDELWQERIAEDIAVPFVFVQGRVYKGNGKQRVLNMVDFYRNAKKAAKAYAQSHGKPDVIYASSVHPLTLVAGIQLADYFGVECICEIRDLWPESLVAYGIVSEKSPITLLLRWLEKWTYRKADKIIFTAEGMYNYIIKQGWEKTVPKNKTHYINNGVDLENFDRNMLNYQVEDDELNDLDVFKIVYTGSVRRVNNLGLLLDTAKLVKDKKVHFLIWGDGDELETLKKRVIDEKIHNTTFKGRVEKKFIPYITTHADLNIAHNEPSIMLQYGVSFNKLFDYMASGKPILSDFPSMYNPAVQCGAGLDIIEPSPENTADIIAKFSDMSQEELKRFGNNARSAAEQQYNFAVLTNKLIQVIEE